jgi:hypothetical protein
LNTGENAASFGGKSASNEPYFMCSPARGSMGIRVDPPDAAAKSAAVSPLDRHGRGLQHYLHAWVRP